VKPISTQNESECCLAPSEYFLATLADDEDTQ
jgi:hypothetical protein